MSTSLKSKTSKAGLVFNVPAVKNCLKSAINERGLSLSIGAGAPVYHAAVLEYQSAEILEFNSPTRLVLKN